MSEIIGKQDPILSMAFACAESRDQAALLNGFARELYLQCKGQNGFEQQICSFTRFLDNDAKKMIEYMAAYIELRTKEIT